MSASTGVLRQRRTAEFVLILPLLLFAASLANARPPAVTPIVHSASQLAGFSVNLGSYELAMQRGSGTSTLVSLSLTGSGSSGFSVRLSVDNLPAGVKAGFGQNPIPANSKGTSLTLSAASEAALTSFAPVTVVATRTADGARSTASFFLSVTPAGLLPPIRTGFLRTNATPTAAAYDASHQRMFVSNPEWNRIDVVSTSSRSVLATIPAPAPAGLALTPDGTQLIAGSLAEQIVVIDTNSLQIVQRAPIPTPITGYINPAFPRQVFPMVNGKVLIGLNTPGTEPYELVEWDPRANTFTPFSTPPGFAFNSEWYLAGSADGANLLAVDYGSGTNFAVYSSATDSFTSTAQTSVGQIFALAASPIGAGFVAVGPAGIELLDENLNIRKIISLPGHPGLGGLQEIYGLVYSPDGASVMFSYLANATYPVIASFNAMNGELLGVAPAFTYCVPNSECSLAMGSPLAADNGGLVLSAAGNGLVFDDAFNFEDVLGLPINVRVPQPPSLTPYEGPLKKPIATQTLNSFFQQLPNVWFSGERATGVESTPSGFAATAPASGSTKQVDLQLAFPNGWLAVSPQALSYGARILFSSGSAAGPGGGVPLDLIGYGLLGPDPGNPSTKVTIGGRPARIVSAGSFLPPVSADYVLTPLDDVKVTVPPGSPGPADIALSSQSGSTTITNGFTYLPNVTDFASPDTLSGVLFDSRRQRVYLSAGAKIDVFDATGDKFLKAFVAPESRIKPVVGGMALTPDASKLLVVDSANLALLVVDPDNFSSVREVALQPKAILDYAWWSPVAGTSNNTAIVSLGSSFSTRCPDGRLFEIDLTTMHATTMPIPQGLSCFSDDTQLTATSKGDRVFLNDDGYGYTMWDAATDSWSAAQYQGNAGDSATSGDGYWFAWNSMGMNSQLTTLTDGQVPRYFDGGTPEFEQMPVIGERLNASGSLLYQPLDQGVDVFDVNSGAWLQRIVLPETVQFVQDAMDLDEGGDRLFLITNAGLTVVKMDPPQLSIGYLKPATGPHSGGTTVTIRGSGFEPGAVVRIGGEKAAATFIDRSTLVITTPELPAGGARVKIANPRGASYSLDAAFTAQ